MLLVCSVLLVECCSALVVVGRLLIVAVCRCSLCVACCWLLVVFVLLLVNVCCLLCVV